MANADELTRPRSRGVERCEEEFTRALARFDHGSFIELLITWVNEANHRPTDSLFNRQRTYVPADRAQHLTARLAFDLGSLIAGGHSLPAKIIAHCKKVARDEYGLEI